MGEPSSSSNSVATKLQALFGGGKKKRGFASGAVPFLFLLALGSCCTPMDASASVREAATVGRASHDGMSALPADATAMLAKRATSRVRRSRSRD